jgi:hypothetical protein
MRPSSSIRRPSYILVTLVAAIGVGVGMPGTGGAASNTQRVPKLGSEIFAGGPASWGWGAYKPQEIYNGGDPTGRVQNIHWSSWGRRTAIGHGTGWYVPSNGDVAGGKSAQIELRAFDLGHCVAGGPLAYQHLDARGPAPRGHKLGLWYSWSARRTLCRFGFGTTSAPSATTTTRPTPSAITGATLQARLPVVSCQTSFGVSLPPSPPLPSSIALEIPSDFEGQLAIYSDKTGAMKLVGPMGWECSALIGADGSSVVKLYPSGEEPPSNAPFTEQEQQAIVGSQTSACVGCRETQACPLFSAAAADYLNNYQMNCPETRPQAESVDDLSPGVVAFEDPPGVAGDGAPSGGPYPANGVMTYYSGDDHGSWLETCTLPTSEHGLCTVALDTFVSWYGSD